MLLSRRFLALEIRSSLLLVGRVDTRMRSLHPSPDILIGAGVHHQHVLNLT